MSNDYAEPPVGMGSRKRALSLGGGELTVRDFDAGYLKMRSWKGRSQSGLDYSGADMYHIWEEEEGVYRL